MNKHINLTAYDNVEQLDNFSEKEFISYCEDKLTSCSKHLAFIQNLGLKNNKLNVCEIGSGNSKLLYALEKHNMIEKADGIEISASRHQFAEKFKQYMSASKVTNINKNMFDITYQCEFDLIFAVDIVFQLIAPTERNAESMALQWIYDSLNDDGYIVLELWSFSKILNQLELASNQLKTWQEFPLSDPFQYVLSNIQQNEFGDLLWNKTFIKRDSKEQSTFDNVLRPYSKDQMAQLLKKYNFRNIQTFDYWIDESDCEEDEFIVIAQK